MKREPNYENMSVAEQIKAGLKDAIAQARGELTLKTTTLPAPAPQMSGGRVAEIRRRAGMSQAVFAGFLNVPKKTLQSWEQGAREPKAGEARLLQLFEASSETVAELVLSADGIRKSDAPRQGRRRKG